MTHDNVEFMKLKDKVRFAKWEDIVDVDDWSTTPKLHVGILIEYDVLNKAARILCDGEVHMIRGQLVEKAGAKDFEKRSDNP